MGDKNIVEPYKEKKKKMKTIYKYKPSVTLEIKMHIGAEILKVDIQHGKFCFWALVDPSKNTESRYFEKFGTGWDITEDESDEIEYIDTVFEDNGRFVWHIFEYLRIRDE